MMAVSAKRGDINFDSIHRVAWQGEDVCLSETAIERIAASRRPFLLLIEKDAARAELWGDEHEAAGLRGLRSFLLGAGQGRRNFQTPVSHCIVPRVPGHAHRAPAGAERAAEVSLCSVSHSPIYVPLDDRGLGPELGRLADDFTARVFAAG